MDGRRLLSVGLVAGLLVATALASVLVLATERADDRQEARGVADQAAAAISATLRYTSLGVRGANALVSPEGEVSAPRFGAFAAGGLQDGTVTVLGWGTLVTPEKRPAWEERRGRPIVAPSSDGTLRRQGDAAQYLPVADVRPSNAANRRTIGYDILAEPERAQAALAARDAGLPRVTAPLVLVGSRRPGVTVYQALYRPGTPTATRSQRRRAFLGVVGGALSVERLQEVVAAQLPDGAAFRVTDGDRTVINGPSVPTATRTVGVLGRTWTVGVTTPATAPHALPAVIGVGGTILALLAGAVVALSSRRERTLVADRAVAEQLAEHDALLLDVGAAVDHAGTMDGRMQALAALLAGRFADICLIDHLDPTGHLRRAGQAASSPELEELLARLPVPSSDSDQAKVLLHGEPLLIGTVDEGVLERIRTGHDDGETRRALGMASGMILPLAAQGVVTGAITLGRGPAWARFTPDDVGFGAQLAQRASLALDNARLYESEHEIATTLQRALLPPALPSPPGVEVDVRYRPAGTGVMVGGDFYDLFHAAEGWIAVVGDVRGKGPRAAAVTALVRHTLRARALTDGVVAALQAVNTALRDQRDDELFCSVAAVEFTLDGDPPHSGRLRAVAAGHPPPLVLSADRSLVALEAAGRLLGPFDDPQLAVAEATLEAGDTVLLYTDGLAEARRGGEQFGEGRLHEAVRTAPRGSLAGLLTHVELEAVTFAQGQPQDDIALVALRLPRLVSSG